MAFTTAPLEGANSVLKAFGAPYRLRENPRSPWLQVYELLPGRRTRERSMRGFVAGDPGAIAALRDQLLEAVRSNQPMEAWASSGTDQREVVKASPCWPEICEAVVAFQRGQGVNMNLVGPFRGKGYFRLLPGDLPAKEADVRRFALHTSESLKARLDDPTAPLIPMPTHRQGFRQKREVVSLLRRAGFEAVAPEALSVELKGMVNRKVAARHIKVTKTGFRAAVPLPAIWVERYGLGGANGAEQLATLRRRYQPRYVNEEGQPFDPERDLVKRCDNNERLGAVCCHKLRSSDAKAGFELKEKLYAWVEVPATAGSKARKRKERCVPYDLRHAYAIRARETTSWNYADVAAVMGHSPEVHRRTYLSEITGEQTKASVVRRLLVG
ncbi:MAG: hypothetical protein NTW02_09385 [Cyanobium sp. LacPavin_0920_WC12_MAG_62_9]|nr:hypothetical protein [Cyanobium sp. LacPavin_0920_WC12_MAG_62_9]